MAHEMARETYRSAEQRGKRTEPRNPLFWNPSKVLDSPQSLRYPTTTRNQPSLPTSLLDNKMTFRHPIHMKRQESHRVLAASARNLYTVKPLNSLPNLALGTRVSGPGSGIISLKPGMYQTNTNSRIASRTIAGSVGGVEKQHNQDSYFTLESNGWVLLGVCDGHGLFGHFVSSFVKSIFPRLVYEAINCEEILNDDLLSISLQYAYAKTVRNLHESHIDCSNSGSTCVTALIRGSAVVCGNVGDSRAVLGVKKDGFWSAVDLSKDHKPNIPEEHQRIVKAGGEVSVSKIVHAGPPRVYVKNEQFPGLAMSRSIGDDVATSVGVSEDPEMSNFRTSKDDKFVVLASDGVWEFISSLEAVKIIAGYWESGDAGKACTALVNEAHLRWTTTDNMVDDITAVVAFLNV